MNFIVENWEKFSLWASTQPTFLQVALGIALFYVAYLALRTVYKVTFFIISGLFSGRPRFSRKRATRPQRQTKPITIDDEAPPFIFRWIRFEFCILRFICNLWFENWNLANFILENKIQFTQLEFWKLNVWHQPCFVFFASNSYSSSRPKWHFRAKKLTIFVSLGSSKILMIE